MYKTTKISPFVKAGELENKTSLIFPCYIRLKINEGNLCNTGRGIF